MTTSNLVAFIADIKILNGGSYMQMLSPHPAKKPMQMIRAMCGAHRPNPCNGPAYIPEAFHTSDAIK